MLAYKAVVINFISERLIHISTCLVLDVGDIGKVEDIGVSV